MTSINTEINRLLNYGIKRGLIDEYDIVYVANRLLCKLELSDFCKEDVTENAKYASEILDNICDYAVSEGLIEDSANSRDLFDTEIMDCLMPRPHEVVSEFYKLYSVSPVKATDYYYELSKNSNYIRVDRIEKDKKWFAPTKYGDLVITINLSKPEKDPRDIAAAKNAVQSGYPKCALCRENEGFKGGATQAARANHRLIPFNIGTEKWFLQYSPYVYYNEHCIILSENHAPMQVNRESMAKLLEFETQFPHYFVGSNADLPIVGGSILSHEHFQGGNYVFPMTTAGIRIGISFSGYEDIDAGILNWPMSVIRLSGDEKDRLVDLADKILTKWRIYSDESADILAFTDETPHNTITPISRRNGEKYELDLVLRNNRTSDEHPLGIFHPHSEYHHIKKENIGLIEVMGLAILPPRLLGEIDLFEQALLNPDKADEIFGNEAMQKHKDWYERLKGQRVTAENARKTIEHSVGEIFMEILSNAGVYKDTDEGNAQFVRFCKSIN